MLRKQKKPDDINYIFGADAARILGVSRKTFYNKIRSGMYNDIDAIRDRLGIKYLIHDIFKIGHPSANKKQIESMIFNWRLKKTMNVNGGRKQ